MSDDLSVFVGSFLRGYISYEKRRRRRGDETKGRVHRADVLTDPQRYRDDSTCHRVQSNRSDLTRLAYPDIESRRGGIREVRVERER